MNEKVSSMITGMPTESRSLKKESLKADFCVVGGGMAGTCAAITAARNGLKVVLVQDRPVLGGNASSEVRLWMVGASIHGKYNRRYAREGGVINEILLENLWRNHEGNAVILDTVILEKVTEEKNITLLLNTAAIACAKATDDSDKIASVEAFCSQNSTVYHIEASFFLDSSGDGILGFLAGAAFRMGAESKKEFGEKFAPDAEFGHLLGDSIYFYSKDVGHPVKFFPPSFALRDIQKLIPRYKQFRAGEDGCHLWWVEWGGRLDTIHESEKIKWELWRVVYGVWDYIKNSGDFPEAANLTLEWVGQIPGKRESRRFEGPYMLSQNDVIDRPFHEDAVAYGGWSTDLHPADGVFAKIAGSKHLYGKGVYQIPFRCYYSRNVKNLFLGGRAISTTHVAFGSTRNMLTCSLGGQVVGQAAALCLENECLPADLSADQTKIKRLQRDLGRMGHDQWGFVVPDEENKARRARVTASSSLQLTSLPADGELLPLNGLARAQMLPVPSGPVPSITFFLDNTAQFQEFELVMELRTTSRPDQFTPDVVLATIKQEMPLGKGVPVTATFPVTLPKAGYVFYTVNIPEMSDTPQIWVHSSRQMLTGCLTLLHNRNIRGEKMGGENFEVFTPKRRPAEQNLAFTLGTPLDSFAPANAVNGILRPHAGSNAWVADFNDPSPTLMLEWDEPETISSVDLFFDVDFDSQMESVLWKHPENAVPYCVKRWRLRDETGRVLQECSENHQAHQRVHLNPAVTTRKLLLEILEMNGPVPATVMEIRCY